MRIKSLVLQVLLVFVGSISSLGTQFSEQDLKEKFPSVFTKLQTTNTTHNLSDYNTWTSFNLNDDLTLYWTINEYPRTISMILKSSFMGWFAIGFGSVFMHFADVLLVESVDNGKTFIVRDITTFIGIPLYNDTDLQGGTYDVLTSFCDNSGKYVTAYIERKLQTNDPYDKPIHSGYNPVIYAYNPDSMVLYYHGRLQRGVASIDFFQNATTLKLPQGPAFEYSALDNRRTFNFMLIHGISMFTIFHIFVPAGILVGRYHSGNWLALHEKLMKFAVSEAATVAIVTFFSTDSAATNAPVPEISLHATLVQILPFLLLFQAFMGICSQQKFLTKYSLYLRKLHKPFGYIIFLCSFGTSYTGLRVIVTQYSREAMWSILYWTISAIILLTFVLLGPLGWLKRFTGVYAKAKSISTEYTVDQFESLVKTGRQLILVNQSIYDIEDFVHPGPDVLSKLFGQDIARYFNGSDNFPDYKAHVHGRYAKLALEGLKIGVIAKSKETHNGNRFNRNPASLKRINEHIDEHIDKHIDPNEQTTFTLREFNSLAMERKWVKSGKDIFCLTEFESNHPGGEQVIRAAYGMDIADVLIGKQQLLEMDHVHSSRAFQQIQNYKIGIIV
jgi:cytochrome b involved in lipid metabolism